MAEAVLRVLRSESLVIRVEPILKQRLEAALRHSSAHVASQLRLQVCQRGPGHAFPSGLSRPSQHPKHRSLHRDGAGSVQGVGAGIALRVKGVSPSPKAHADEGTNWTVTQESKPFFVMGRKSHG
jgi:hypothetical protein